MSLDLRRAFIDGDFKFVYHTVKKLTVAKFIAMTFADLTEEFKIYINICAEHVFDSNKEVTWKSVHKCGIAVSGAPNFRKKLGATYEGIVTSIIDHWRQKQEQRKKKTEITIGQVYWNLPYQDIQGVRVTTMDFSDFPLSLMHEAQSYLTSWVIKGEQPLGLSRRFHHLAPVVKAINETSGHIGSFLELTYVGVRSIFDYLQQEKSSTGRKKYSIKSIQTHFSECRLLFDWLLETRESDSLKNPFRRFKFHNVNGFIKSAQYIPEDVIEQLSVAIQDCSNLIQRFWLIMMNTGARGIEVSNLEEDCMAFNEKEQIYYLKYKVTKSLKARRKRGEDDFHFVPLIALEVVNAIREQINETADLRRISGTKKIFIKTANDRITAQGNYVRGILRTNIQDSINKCIKRNGIKDHDGNLWHYTNQQCRKTLGVRLLSEGSSIAEVGDILNQLEEKTTRLYYQDVDAMKIATLDRQLFEQLFDSIPDDLRRTYSQEELEALKVEIMSGARETPEGHGSCLKHVSFGPCKKRSCVGCHLLLTGPQKLGMWNKLFHEQEVYLNSMVQSMKNQGIHDFETYRDYQAERHLLETYKDTINKIERFIEERGIEH